jgi:predicted RNase H-like HicB family nuclease
MGDTIAELLTNAQEAVQLWAEDVIASKADLPEPRSIDEVRRDSDVARDLAEGGLLAVVPLVMEIGRPVKANLSLDAGLLTAIDEAPPPAGLPAPRSSRARSARRSLRKDSSAS